MRLVSSLPGWWREDGGESLSILLDQARQILCHHIWAVRCEVSDPDELADDADGYVLSAECVDGPELFDAFRSAAHNHGSRIFFLACNDEGHWAMCDMYPRAEPH